MRKMNRPGIKKTAGLLLCIALFAVCVSPAGFTVDLSQPCSFKVSYGDSDFSQELREADIVFDVYKLADAVEDDTYEYRYQMLPLYAELEYENGMDNAAQKALGQQALDIALTADTPIITGAEVEETITRDDSGEAIYTGLYLIVPRGRELEDYITKRVDDEGNEVTGTLARSDLYEYIFAPDLVGLAPDRELAFSLKAVREPRKGRVEIVKTLLTYESGEPATFVFNIDAVYNGETVYSDVSAFTFEGAGSQSIVIDDLPLGAVVTVVESYDGTHYRSVTDTQQTVTVLSEETATVEFINDYDGGGLGGHGIINRFTYDGEIWVWTQN